MKTILYLSPHLDDVVFSCLSHLLTQSTEGNRTIVATIFTEGDHDRRKEEDIAALQSCGAERHWMGYLDAPFRGGAYDSFSSITLGEPDGFRVDLSALIEVFQPDQIIAPLGVGGHIDHRVVFDAVRQIKHDNIWYYEERPYGLIKGATELRLHQLGFEVELPEFDEFWKEFKNANYVKRLLPASEEGAVKEVLARNWQINKGRQMYRYMEIPFVDHPAAMCYSSQIDDFMEADVGERSERLYCLAQD